MKCVLILTFSALVLFSACADEAVEVTDVGADLGVAQTDASRPAPDTGRDTALRDVGAVDFGVDGGEPSDAAPDAGVVEVDSGTPITASVRIRSIARATCGALFRCCDAADLVEFFAPIRRDGETDWVLASFRGLLPPDASNFDETACEDALTQVYSAMPFGDWFAAVDEGLITLDEAELTQCIDALAVAACGDEVRDALFNSTCLGFPAPIGAQRRMFKRTSQAGDVCGMVRDGVGARIYGTCDPTAAFCCFRPNGDPNAPCWLGDPSVPSQRGTCVAASQAGETCGLFPAERRAQFCRTGLDCDDRSADPNQWQCVASEGTMPLANGEVCAVNFALVGECTNGWCDLLGTSLCEPFKPNGETCTSPYECSSERCESSTCVENSLCAM